MTLRVTTPLTDETKLSADLRIRWSKDDPRQVSRAEESFEKYLSQGWIAFSDEPNGRRIIHRFNPDLNKIILIPPLGGGQDKNTHHPYEGT